MSLGTNPDRLCTCGHNASVHRGGPRWDGKPGRCRIIAGCTSEQFREDRDVPKLVPDGSWMAPIRRDWKRTYSRHQRPAA